MSHTRLRHTLLSSCVTNFARTLDSKAENPGSLHKKVGMVVLGHRVIIVCSKRGEASQGLLHFLWNPSLQYQPSADSLASVIERLAPKFKHNKPMSSSSASRGVHVVNSVIKSQKQAMRKSIGASLRRLSSDELDEQSRSIGALLLSFQRFREAKAVSCYLSMPTAEARTLDIVNTILEEGKALYVPKIQSKGDSTMDLLRIYSAEDLASLPAGTWGIKEPGDHWQDQRRTSILGSPSDAHLDVIILPGVAFDRNLLRLGHGKGYYDRFITAYVASGRPKPFLVGICLREQLLAEGNLVPGETHDWTLDVLVTADEIITKQE